MSKLRPPSSPSAPQRTSSPRPHPNAAPAVRESSARPAAKATGGRTSVAAPPPRPPLNAAAKLARLREDQFAREILDAAGAMRDARGPLCQSDFESLLKRAMASQPGRMHPAAAEAIDYIVDQHEFAQDAQPMAAILRDARQARAGGVISEQDLEGMMRRAWKPDAQSVDAGAAMALRFIGWRDAPIMDAGARQLMSEFVSAWYQDQVESAAVVEGRRQIEEQLAQDKRDFRDFMVTDRRDFERVEYDDFKAKLQDDRIDTSEWQSLMLWLQNGVKSDPITS